MQGSLGEEASPGNPDIQSLSSGSLTERLSQLSQQDRMSWEESVRQADRLDGLVRKEHPEQQREPSEKRQKTMEHQIVGGQVFPPSLPHPARASGELIPVPSSAGSSAASSSHGLTTHVCLVGDSGAKAIALSTEEGDEDFVLRMDDEADHVLLAGGRNELNLKADKWNSREGQQRIIAGVRKEVKNVVDDKQALRPLSIEQSRHVRQNAPDRIVPSKLVLVEKLDDAGEELVKARWTARGDKDPDLMSLIRQGSTQSPTISSNGRYTVLQTIASHRFPMQLGDVTGAFLEADEMERGNGSPYAFPLQIGVARGPYKGVIL